MAKVHNLEALNSLPNVLTATNPAGDYTLFVVDANPNGVVTGEPGDFAIVDQVGDADHGRWYRNIGAGATSTVWGEVAAKQVYGDAGAPTVPPVDPSNPAVYYDNVTQAGYVWDVGGATWEPLAGNVLDWHQTGNAGTSPLSAGGPDFVGTTDAVGLSLATNGNDRVNLSATGDVTVRPDGTNDRVTITDVETTIVHTDGTQTATGYTGDSILGSGEFGSGDHVSDATHFGAVFTHFNGSTVESTAFVADSSFSGQGYVAAKRDSPNDKTRAEAIAETNNGNGASLVSDADGAADTSTAFGQARDGGVLAQFEASVAADVPRVHLDARDGVDLREINVFADEIEIGAGDVASNTVGGAAGMIPVRFGTGSVVRFDTAANVLGNGYAESRVVAAAGVETITHSLAVVASLLGDFPVNVTVIDDATNQVVVPDTIDFTVGANAIDIGFAAAGTYRVYIGRMIG